MTTAARHGRKAREAPGGECRFGRLPHLPGASLFSAATRRTITRPCPICYNQDEKDSLAESLVVRSFTPPLVLHRVGRSVEHSRDRQRSALICRYGPTIFRTGRDDFYNLSSISGNPINGTIVDNRVPICDASIRKT